MTIDAETLQEIDPGVRRLVAFLNEHGFETTDSGDGVSKPADRRELDFPHVFMSTRPVDLIDEASRLFSLLDQNGLTADPGTIEASYDVADGSAIIALYSVDDAMLFGGGS